MSDLVNDNKLIINTAMLNDWESQTADAVKFSDIDQAKYFTREVWPQINLVKELPEISQRLQRLFWLNSIILIPALSEKQLLDLLENGINLYFQEMTANYDLWQEIRAFLVGRLQEDRDAIKEKMRRALLNNKELITTNKIERNDNIYFPYIKEWLIDYTSVVGINKVDSLVMNEYFFSNRNCKKLNGKERQRVRILIELYERLKRSSMEPDGFEEKVSINVDGREIIFNEGRFEETGLVSKKIKDDKAEPKGLLTEPELVKGLAEPEEKGSEILEIKAKPKQVSSTAEQEEIIKAYQGDLKQRKIILKLEEKLTKKLNNDINKLRAEFFVAVQAKDMNRTIASLRLLTRMQDLPKFLKDDPKLNKFLAAIWEKRYGQEFIAEFAKNAGAVKFIRLFLRYVLEERLGLAVSDAARIGMQLGNIFIELGQKEFNRLTYFDVKSKSFSWFE